MDLQIVSGETGLVKAKISAKDTVARKGRRMRNESAMEEKSLEAIGIEKGERV